VADHPFKTAGRRLGPGIYLFENEVHLDAEELCAAAGVPCTASNVRAVTEAAQDVLARMWPGREIPVEVREDL